MVSPEYSQLDPSPVLTSQDLQTALANVDRLLEMNEDNENTIERTFRREAILEERDELQAEIDLSAPPPEHS